MAHDYKRFPELRKAQLEEFGFMSPHPQITEDFRATVVRVVDGDTITLRASFRDFDFPLRILDIDAPELNAGGEKARDWLKGRIEGEEVDIRIDRYNRVDKYGRLLGAVFAQGFDVGEEELRLGLAVPFDQRRESEFPDLNKELNIKKWL
jgi:endonuclease YncB( thermonuclease family)